MSSRWSPDLDVADLMERAARLAAQILQDSSAGAVTRTIPAADLHALGTAPAPATGRDVAAILDAVATTIAPYPMGNGHPRFMAWVNPPPHPVGVAGALLAAALNPSVAGGWHAAVHVEHAVARWFLELLGWQSDGYGLFVSGGSAATTTALAAARHRAFTTAGHDDRARGLAAGPVPVVFATAEAHSCATKAVELLGIGSHNIVRIATDSRHRMDPADLQRQLVAAVAAGRLPVAVVASAGTVNTGVIDPIAEIAAICRAHGVWLHVDGAYGGPPALLLDRFADVRDALAGADSMALDPHKWLYVPAGAGMILFRDADAARSTFSLVPAYLEVSHSADEPPWFAEYGSEQTRSFRALKLWMTLQYLGFDGYRELITRDLETAEVMRRAIDRADDLELLPGELSVVCFRHLPPGLSGERLDEHNRRLSDRLQRGGEAFLAPTVVDGVTALRACIVDPRTDADDVTAVLDAVRRAAPTEI